MNNEYETIKNNIKDCEQLRSESIAKIKSLFEDGESNFETDSYLKEIERLVKEIRKANQLEDLNYKNLNKIISK